MKHKNMSFAAVLKGKSRSPQPQSKASNSSLAEMLEQWEEYPEGDFTLYLGSFTRSFKSQHSTNKMFSSKSPADQD